jgi:predicted peptidase
MDSVQVNGTTRTFVLYIPANYNPNQAYPVVTLFHGIGATGAEMAAYIQMQIYSGNDAIVAFPDAVNGNWDLSGDTDLQFYDAMIAQLEGKLCIDQQRQFELGFSLGAYMANHLGCNRPAIRAFVAADGGFNDRAASCNTASAFIYHRQEDDNENIQNGINARNEWLGIDGCTMTTVNFTQDGFLGPGGDSSQPNGCVQYTGCSTTPPVTWCEDTYISPEGYKHDLRDVYRVPMWNFFNSLK